MPPVLCRVVDASAEGPAFVGGKPHLPLFDARLEKLPRTLDADIRWAKRSLAPRLPGRLVFRIAFVNRVHIHSHNSKTAAISNRQIILWSEETKAWIGGGDGQVLGGQVGTSRPHPDSWELKRTLTQFAVPATRACGWKPRLFVSQAEVALFEPSKGQFQMVGDVFENDWEGLFDCPSQQRLKSGSDEGQGARRVGVADQAFVFAPLDVAFPVAGFAAPMGANDRRQALRARFGFSQSADDR